ncbi:MAG: lipopolysaccharide heptosyltransferase II [Planctomycetota bacterium]
MPAEPPIPSSVERLLVVCPSWVGDTIMATPLLRAARRALPRARIIAACRHGLDELLAATPWLDDVIAGETKTVRGMLGLARRLRREGPEAVLLCPNSFRSALLARLCAAPRRVGYRRYGRGPLLTHALRPQPSKAPTPALTWYARLAAYALGLDDIDPRMQLFVADAQRAEAARLLEGVSRPYAVLCPGANKAAKRWPAERFAAVADALAGLGLAAVATGAPGEREVVAEVSRAAAVPVLDLVQRGLGIGSLKAVIADAALCVTNDTGPRHVAAALGTPVVTLFGPTDHRWTTIECPHEQILVAEPFLPEPLVADDHARHCAITRIPVADVLAAAERLLSGRREGAPRRETTNGPAFTAGPPDQK